MSSAAWEPAEPLELKKNFAFYPLGDGGAGHHAAKKRRDRKKRLSTFGLDGLDEIINQDAMVRIDSFDGTDDDTFSNFSQATPEEPPEMSFVDKATGFLAQISSPDKTVNLVCNGMSANHPTGRYIAACYSKGNVPLCVFDVYESDKGGETGTEHILFSSPTKELDDGMYGDEDVSNTLDLGRVVRFSPCGQWLALGGKGKAYVIPKEGAATEEEGIAQGKTVNKSSLLIFRTTDVCHPERCKTAKPAFDLSIEGNDYNSVVAMEFSNNGKYLVVSTEDKNVWCYKVNHDKKLKNMPARWDDPPDCLLSDFKSDGMHFCRYSTPIFPYNSKRDIMYDIEGQAAPSAFSFNANDTKLAIGVSSTKHLAATVYILDMTGEREPIKQIKFRHPTITDLAYSQTGKWLAVAGRVDNTLLDQDPEASTGGVGVWNARSYDPECWIKKKVAAVTSVAWGVGDKRMVIGDSNMYATVYATYTWAKLAERKLGGVDSDSTVREVLVNKFADIFICGGVKTPIEAYRFSIWNSSKELNLKDVHKNDDVDVHPTLAVTDPLRSFKYYTDVTWRGGITTPEGKVEPDSSVCALTYGNEILIHDAHGGKKLLCRTETPHPGNLGVIAWSDDGKYLAVGYREGVRQKKHTWKQKMSAYAALKKGYDEKQAAKKTHSLAAKPKTDLAPGSEGVGGPPVLKSMASIGNLGALMSNQPVGEDNKDKDKDVEMTAPKQKATNGGGMADLVERAGQVNSSGGGDDEEDKGEIEDDDADIGPEPVKPPEPDLKDDPETFYVLIYDASQVIKDPSKPGHEPSSLKLIQSIPFNETITSLDWGKMSLLLSVTSADVDPTDNVQQGSCRVFKKMIGAKDDSGRNTVRWERESPEQFPFVATPQSRVEENAALWLEELCTEYKIPAMKSVSAFGFNSRRKSGAADEKTRLMSLCDKLKEGADAEAKQLKLYDRFTQYIVKNTNAYVQEASKLAKTIELTDPNRIAKKLAVIICKLYPVCDISKFDRVGNLLAVGLSREVLIFDTSSWSRVASVGREKEVGDDGKPITLDNKDLEHRNSVSYLEWSPSGKILAVSRKAVSIRFYDAETKKFRFIKKLAKTKNASDLSWSLDDAYFVAICPDDASDTQSTAISVFKTVKGYPKNCVQRWSTPDGSVGKSYFPHKTVASEWSPDGSCLAEVGLTKMNHALLEARLEKESISESMHLNRELSFKQASDLVAQNRERDSSSAPKEKEKKTKKDKGTLELATYFSIWYRGFNLNPQLVPLDLPPSDLVTVLEEYPETLYVSRDYDTLIQNLIEEQRFTALSAIIQRFPLSAGALKMYTDEQTQKKVVTNAFTVAVKMRDENSLRLLLETAALPSVIGSSLPYVAAESLPAILDQGFQDLVIEYMRNLPFHECHECPIKQANLEDGAKFRSSSTFLNTSYRNGLIREQGGLWGDAYDPVGMQVTASFVALPNLGNIEILEAFCKANSSIFDNETMTAVLYVLWEEHIKRLFWFKSLTFLVMTAAWIALIQQVVAQPATIVIDNTARITYSIVILINLWYVWEEYRQAKGSPGGIIKHFSEIWNILDFLTVLFMVGFVFLLEYDTTDDTYIFIGVAGTLLLMLKSLSFLRGFESTGWLITVLTQNISDVRPFLIVMMVIILGSSVAFNLLLSKAVDDESGAMPYDGWWNSFFSVFLMSVLGDFNTDLFTQAGSAPSEFSKLICQLVFLFVVLFITVVALNALIALLGDSYAKVSELETANKSKERAELICEYMGVMRGSKRRDINRMSKFFHRLTQKSTNEEEEAPIDKVLNVVSELMAKVNELTEKISKLENAKAPKAAPGKPVAADTSSSDEEGDEE